MSDFYLTTNAHIKKLIWIAIQGWEYHLDNTGPWDTPEGRAGLIEALADLQKVLLSAAVEINGRMGTK